MYYAGLIGVVVAVIFYIAIMFVGMEAVPSMKEHATKIGARNIQAAFIGISSLIIIFVVVFEGWLVVLVGSWANESEENAAEDKTSVDKT